MRCSLSAAAPAFPSRESARGSVRCSRPSPHTRRWPTRRLSLPQRSLASTLPPRCAITSSRRRLWDFVLPPHQLPESQHEPDDLGLRPLRRALLRGKPPDRQAAAVAVAGLQTL